MEQSKYANSSKGYVLTLLTAIYVLHYADRLIFGIVLQDIKRDLSLSDTQMGLLSGLAFSFLFALVGVPLGRLADRSNRIKIISVSVTVWSAAVALCGATHTFFQMMLARMGVAIGEAGCYAPSLSVISDQFDREERPRAIARYVLANPIAVFLAFFGAGWINELYGWRLTFLAFGLPGLILGPLAWLTLRDPRSATPAAETAEDAPPPQPIAYTIRVLWTNRAFRNLFFYHVIWGFFGWGVSQWQPAFFQRTYGLSTGQLGTALALVQGGGWLLGAYLGGELASRYARLQERRQLAVAGGSYILLAVVSVGIFASPNYLSSLICVFIFGTVLIAGNGPLTAAVQSVLPPGVRSTAVSMMMFVMNLIGVGLGPLAIGAISDLVHPWFGADSLRIALLTFLPGYLWCGWHLWSASRTVDADIATSEALGTT